MNSRCAPSLWTHAALLLKCFFCTVSLFLPLVFPVSNVCTAYHEFLSCVSSWVLYWRFSLSYLCWFCSFSIYLCSVFSELTHNTHFVTANVYHHSELMLNIFFQVLSILAYEFFLTAGLSCLTFVSSFFMNSCPAVSSLSCPDNSSLSYLLCTCVLMCTACLNCVFLSSHTKHT